MNLLRIQDALKNASDQQLMQMMQAPDSTAPSYLVLSEIRRRKDMRAQQAPEGDSRRTVAEELTAPQDQGIRGMQMQEQAPQEETDQSGIEAMREGGVVRMQAGGDINSMSYDQLQQLLGQVSDPRFRPPGVTATPDQIRQRIADLERGQEDVAARAPRSRLRQDLGSIGEALHGAAGATGSALADVGRAAIGAGRQAAQYAFEPVEPRSPFPPGRFEEPEPVRGELDGLGPRFAEPDALRGPELRDLLPSGARPGTPAPPQGQRPQGQQGQPGDGQARPAGGGGGGGGAATAATETAAPTLAELYRQNQGLFADGIGALRERAQQERVDPAARRNEALNMALIEAGLRIAGSRNPSLAGAIGEGAVPAVQSYGQQLGQIRAEQREARRDELELAKQELSRQFAIGQISATEYRTRMDNVNANLRAASAERAAGARAAEAENRMDQRAQIQARLQADDLRRRGYYTPEEFAALPPAQQALVRELRTIGRPADTAGAGTVLNATVAEIGRIRTEMDNDPAPRPTSSGYAEWQRRNADRERRLREAEQRRNLYEGIVVGGRPPGGQAGATGAGGQGPGISRFGG